MTPPSTNDATSHMPFSRSKTMNSHPKITTSHQIAAPRVTNHHTLPSQTPSKLPHQTLKFKTTLSKSHWKFKRKNLTQHSPNILNNSPKQTKSHATGSINMSTPKRKQKPRTMYNNGESQPTTSQSTNNSTVTGKYQHTSNGTNKTSQNHLKPFSNASLMTTTFPLPLTEQQMQTLYHWEEKATKLCNNNSPLPKCTALKYMLLQTGLWDKYNIAKQRAINRITTFLNNKDLDSGSIKKKPGEHLPWPTYNK